MVPLDYDRREIEPLLVEKFPDMAGASSSEWAGFLDEMTGLTTDIDTPNGAAFDAWRKALAKNGYPDLWPFTAEDIGEMKLRGIEMAKAEKKRIADLAAVAAVQTDNG